MRRPIEVEFKGLQTPRERVWTAIRALRTGFSILSVQDHCAPMVKLHVVDDYMRDLLAAGFIAKTAKGRHIPGRRGAVKQPDLYELVNDQFEAPRLKDGRVVTVGLGNVAMWRAMKVLTKGFDFKELATIATQGDIVVTTKAAKCYIGTLLKAGYLRTVSEGRGNTPGRYALVKNTGPHPPAITKRNAVFDRNTGEFVALETAQEVCDALAE